MKPVRRKPEQRNGRNGRKQGPRGRHEAAVSLAGAQLPGPAAPPARGAKGRPPRPSPLRPEGPASAPLAAASFSLSRIPAMTLLSSLLSLGLRCSV